VASAAPILALAARAVGGGTALYVFDGDGKPVAASPGRVPLALDEHGQLHPDAAAALTVVERTFDDLRVILTRAAGESAEEAAQFLDMLLQLVADRRRLEAELESMQPSTLELFEETNMWYDVLPALNAGQSEEEVVEIALKKLVDAASVERAVYLRCFPDVRSGEVVVMVGMDDAGRHAVRVDSERRLRIDAGDDIVWQAMSTRDEAMLVDVPDGSGFGSEASPLRLARRQVIAVPVRYCAGERTTTLGVILLIDRRPKSYGADRAVLSSQETKLAYAAALMIGSVLGTRQAAELGKELQTAHEIQDLLKPRTPPRVPGFDLAGRNRASGTVGGDYYDFLPMHDKRTLAVVADVSGHNLASGMHMVSARMSLRLLARRHGSPARILDDLAVAMFEDLQRTERFITAAAAAISANFSDVDIVNAGHNSTLVYRAARATVERVDGMDTVLGFAAGASHGVQRVQLSAGDVILLYTDGITEAVDDDEEMFGEERLASILRRCARMTAAQILDQVFKAVDSFETKRSKGDDMTAVVIKACPEARGVV
jgi:hypothetical protein